MNRKTWLLPALSLPLTILCARAQAQCQMELEVAESKEATLAIYEFAQETPTQAGTVDRALALKQKALDCNESWGLVKIELADHRIVWIKRRDTRPVATSGDKPVCVTQAVSKEPGHVIVGASGAEPAQAACLEQ